MKVLILSCNCGEGHNSAGKAVQEQFLHRGIPCEIRDTLSFESERASRFVGNVHTKSALYAPRLSPSATSLRNAKATGTGPLSVTARTLPMPAGCTAISLKTGLIPS